MAAVVAEKDAELQAVQDALRQQLEVQLQLQRAEADLEISDLEVGAWCMGGRRMGRWANQLQVHLSGSRAA